MKKWIDENGLEIPANRVTKTEKLRERKAEALLKKADKIEQLLSGYKEAFEADTEEVFMAVMDEEKVNSKKYKGNFTWYNFDRSIKIERNVNEKIDFDETLIAAAKQKFDEFIKNATGGVDLMIQSLINDAFSTSRGKLDAKKVMGLLQHKSRIDEKRYPLFHEAASLIERSIRRPDSKTYFRIWKKDKNGEYQSVNLNFSSL